MAAKIRKGDKVVILAGKDKGKTGSVLRVIPDETKAVVQGINLIRRHTKQSASQDAGIFTREAPIHLSEQTQADPRRLSDQGRRQIARRQEHRRSDRWLRQLTSRAFAPSTTSRSARV
jgi:large subunit ribosomal protein L24